MTSIRPGRDELLDAGTRRSTRPTRSSPADELTDSVDEVAASMSELSEQVSAVAGTARVSDRARHAGARLARAPGIRYGVRRRRTRARPARSPRRPLARPGAPDA